MVGGAIFGVDPRWGPAAPHGRLELENRYVLGNACFFGKLRHFPGWERFSFAA